ncbi:MAG TPA: ROK family protein [candidate division Zixibacteria bacterium]|nr:ROK family protein [candidate division Zixibacteria bacterium]
MPDSSTSHKNSPHTAVKTEKKAFAGIDVGGTNIKFGLFHPDGKIIYKEQRPTMADKGATPLMHLITNIAERLIMHASEDELEVPWLGVGTPGAIDFKTGQVLGPTPNIAGWEGMEVGENLRNRLNMSVWVDNDVNAMALAELRFGAAVGASSAVCITVGTGIGGAVIVDGKVVRGHTHSAGEIGHTTINFDGPPCKCGKKGCVEVYCSTSAIITRAKKKLEKDMTPVFQELLGGDIQKLNVKVITAAARQDDYVAKEVLEETAEYLAIGLGNMANVLNPQIMVVGGGIVDGSPEFINYVSASIRKQAFPSAVKELKVTKAALGNDAGFIGAGLLGEHRN